MTRATSDSAATATGAGLSKGPAPHHAEARRGLYATIPCGSMTYFLAAPWSKRW
jgi:hypothetical protein